MKTNIQAVLFDLDGTLVDTAPDFIRIIKKMCSQHNHPCPTDEAIRQQVSAGATAMVRLIFGEELADNLQNDAKLLSYRQEFLDLYEQDICVDSCLFLGLDELLQQLQNKQIPWGVVTNKPRYLAEKLLKHFKWTQGCAVLVCPDDVKQTKPHPEPMYLACQKLLVDPSACIYVGDHIRDIQAGKAAGMMTAVAAFGYITPDVDIQTWGADAILQTPRSLSDWILQRVN